MFNNSSIRDMLLSVVNNSIGGTTAYSTAGTLTVNDRT